MGRWGWGHRRRRQWTRCGGCCNGTQRPEFSVDAALKHPFLAPLCPHPPPLFTAVGPTRQGEEDEGEDDEAERDCGAGSLGRG
jgi:hypothetical protein